MSLVNIHCPKCDAVVCVSHLRLDTEKVRAETERAALAAHRCETKPRCPICRETNIMAEFRPNHVPKHDVTGVLTGYDPGTPTARVMCAEGCYVAVRGQVQVAELAKAMGLPAVPKEEG